MNKLELVREVSKQSNLTQKDCLNCIVALKDVITKTLQKGEIISLVGFGRFYTKQSLSKVVYNPVTQQKHFVKSQILPKFRASASFKEQILA